VTHAFEIEINVLVKVNHALTIAAIGQLEQNGIAETRENFEDRDIVDSLIKDLFSTKFRTSSLRSPRFEINPT
jgi:hypothetical protein